MAALLLSPNSQWLVGLAAVLGSILIRPAGWRAISSSKRLRWLRLGALRVQPIASLTQRRDVVGGLGIAFSSELVPCLG